MPDADLADFLERMQDFATENTSLKPGSDTEVGIARWTEARLRAAVDEQDRRRRLRALAGRSVAVRDPGRIGRIKQQADLVEVVTRAWGPPDVMGDRGYAWRCGFHSEKTPSFKINVGRDPTRWHCFGACNRGGDVIDFVMQETGDFGRALDVLDPGRTDNRTGVRDSLPPPHRVTLKE